MHKAFHSTIHLFFQLSSCLDDSRKKKPFNNEGGQKKDGRRKEVLPDNLPGTRISSFKLFSPLFNFGIFQDLMLLAVQTAIAAKINNLPPVMTEESPFFDTDLISWSI